MRTSLSTLALAALLVGPSTGATQAPEKDAISEQSRKEAREHYQAGMEKMRAETFAEAAEEFQAAVKLDRLFVLAHYQLGEARMALKQYPEAVAALEGCVAAHKEVVRLQETDRAVGEKRMDEEIQTLKDSIRLYQSGTTKSVQPQNQILKLETQLHELERPAAHLQCISEPVGGQ